jgi:signal transduction histidine kinase/DNA-binding response OmpR family regulator
MTAATSPPSGRTRDQLVRQAFRLSKVLCLVALVFPFSTACGWIFGIPLLTQFHPALPPIQPNTGVGLAIGALAILLTPERPSMNQRTPIVLLLASSILLLGLLTLSEYAFGWDLGIDRILTRGAPTASQPFPGRPLPQTSLNFVLLGAVLLSFNLGIWPLHLGQVAWIAVGANSITAATAYIFSTRTLYGFPLHTPAIGMAVHTSIAFVILFVALLCRRPNEGMMTLVTSDTHSGAIARRILLAGIIAPPLVGALTRLGVAAGWYDISTQGSLFVLILAGLILRAIWSTARRSEHEELQTRQAKEEITRLYENVRRLDELKTQFFANVSHELRTPLTLILGTVEKHLRKTEEPDSDRRRDLEVIERNARTLSRHVNDLLDVARFDAARLEPEYSEANASALVRVVADHFSALAIERDITFVVDIPPALPVQTDSLRLQRILLNLLSNAFKFTPRGGHVRVSLRDAGPQFRVEVGDSGPGIPPDKGDAVFERFQQLERDSHLHSGTGLGLSIVRDFAALLGGQASVADAPEGGALFVLDVPASAPPGHIVGPAGEQMSTREVAQQVDELRRPHAAADAGGTSVKSGGGRILVVEDDPDMNRFIAESLQSDGFDVLSAFDGAQGYEMAVTERPDLVLTDIMMPRMSGDELVRRLRENADLSSTPIVVLTARIDDELRVRLLREGAQDYLDKPLFVAELRARVQNLVARKRAEDHVSRLRRQLEAVSLASTQISEAVASLPEESVQTVFQTLARNAQELTGAEFAAAGVGGDATHPFEISAFAGIDPEMVEKIGRLPRPPGLHHPEIRSFLGVPIRFRGHAVGSLYLANKRNGAEFTPEDEEMAEMLASRAGSAIETARLYAAEGRAHSWLQAVVDQMPEGIILMDEQGRVTLENRSLQGLANAMAPVSDRFGNHVTIDLRLPTGERLTPDEFPIVKAMVGREVTWGQELLARRADDRLVCLLVSAAPIVTATGTLAGAAMVLQDISALKELDRRREEWASIVTHDLRQPISVIALRSSLLLRTSLSDDQRESVRQINALSQRLGRMTSDLMDASLLESHRLRISTGRLDLGQLLHDVVDRVPLNAPRTTMRTPPDRHLFVHGDAHRLEQVVTNLLLNAEKYRAPNTVIAVELKDVDRNAEILVTNRGPGIPPDELPLLFERFARSREAKGSTVKGLGLGLYIAKGLVKAHGGQIWAESIRGDVTTFHVTIPLDGPPVAVGGEPMSDAVATSELHAE